LRSMLKELSIEAKIDKNQFKLHIRGKRNLTLFLEKIPIKSFIKKQRLISNLTNFYNYKSGPMLIKEKYILSKIVGEDLTLKEISALTGINNLPQVKFIIDDLRKRGLVKKVVKGISQRPRKKITYASLKPMENRFYSYIDEVLINSDLITKTVDFVSFSDYNGFVYDITNAQDLPNFTLSNGIIVHNSTRSEIIDNLFQRNYVRASPIEVTQLGLVTIETLKKYCPEILDEELTRTFELDMEQIMAHKKNKEDILEEAKKFLTKTLKRFKQNEQQIGSELGEALKQTREEETVVGKCEKCGGNLRLIRSKKFGSWFAACSNYPNCKNTFSLPFGLPKPAGAVCKSCGSPLVLMIRKGKRPYSYCINKSCPEKLEWQKKQQELNS
ncbi:topoisomerase DNA-binding C4 zinc finger domain-containing protein, partial [Candidatus Woesearchaeota archaeon]|nr:topoisomerase DNA-binding C4 zinc finger domain-containing protein [Candidatus Woesearchaeota archaeon]